MAYSGKFKPMNPDKYVGDPTSIVWRSLWELQVMREFDRNPNVIRWASEETVIPYISPLDGRRHRYFPDFWAEVITPAGTTKRMLVEVKPYAQTVQPKPPPAVAKTGKVRRNSRFMKELQTYAVNQAKWNAAQMFCEQRGWDFEIITEKELGLSR